MNLSEINMHVPESLIIIDWVDDYLRGIGSNRELADGLLKAKRYWLGPIIISLNKLKRTCGPEKEMEYQLTEQSFHETVQRVKGYIEQGRQMEPLLCQFNNMSLWIRDGNHRHEALNQLALQKYWVLIRTDTELEYQQLIQFLSLDE